MFPGHRRNQAPLASSTICEKRRLEALRARHLDNLQSPKSSGYSKKPVQYEGKLGHIKYNAKRQLMQKQRQEEIEQENRVLFEKMIRIMDQTGAGPTQLAAKKASQPYAPGCRLTSNMYPVQDNYNVYRMTSMNKKNRDTRLHEIQMQNIEFLRRLQGVQSHYNSHDWLKDRKKQLEYMRIHAGKKGYPDYEVRTPVRHLPRARAGTPTRPIWSRESLFKPATEPEPLRERGWFPIDEHGDPFGPRPRTVTAMHL
eukprot:Rmarinus@m.6481